MAHATSQSPTVTLPAELAGSASFDVEAAGSLVPPAAEAVRFALVPAVGVQTGGNAGQGTLTATPIPFGDQVGNRDGSGPVFNFPQRPSGARETATLHALQEWEGYVVEFDREKFVARLVDLTTASTHEEEEAVIPMAEVSDCDIAGLGVGSIFRWVIGYERSPAGTKKRVSQIVFRDLPRISERDYEDGKNWARDTLRAFKP